ncbi:MAG TPA: CAP domain-containing protein [Nannocystaceae bacterium]|nr:CAP domain-containing protein [Nannocystaceae bacterium]
MPHRFFVAVLALVACKEVATPSTAAPHRSDARTATPPPRSTRREAPRGRGEQGKLVGLTDAHNRVRAEVGVGPLAWSDELERYASAWASQLAAKGCDLVHRGDGRYGENIFWSSNASTAADVVAQWAAERVGYDHRRNRCEGTCGHFTQIVWKRSAKLGCGMASCGGGGEIWVCNYDPAGNVMGQSPY